MALLNLTQAAEAAQLIRWINQKGWSPATSTNYSFRNTTDTIAISQSGIDKSLFGVEHWMLIDLQGRALADYAHLKSSAETLLHTVLYQENPQVGAILHTHSVVNTVLSRMLEGRGPLVLSGYEMLKALAGIQTHETTVELPIFPNTQDIATLSEDFRALYRLQPELRGYLIAGHGLYTWGKNLAEAKRHLETLEFLLECYGRQHRLL